MTNWLEHVRRRMGSLDLEPFEQEEICAELAAHLEENFEGLLRRGLAEDEARSQTLSQVQDWSGLVRKIQNAKSRENLMNDRVKQFWLPSLLSLVLSMGLLMLIERFGPSPWVIAPEHKRGWSLIAAAFLTVAPAAVVYLPWLFLLPFIGAMGAYLSNRTGGSQRAMLTSIVFPVLTYLVFFLLALPVTALFHEGLGHNIWFLVLFLGLLAWVVAPGAALLTGGVLARFLLSRRLDSRRVPGN